MVLVVAAACVWVQLTAGCRKRAAAVPLAHRGRLASNDGHGGIRSSGESELGHSFSCLLLLLVYDSFSFDCDLGRMPATLGQHRDCLFEAAAGRNASPRLRIPLLWLHGEISLLKPPGAVRIPPGYVPLVS